MMMRLTILGLCLALGACGAEQAMETRPNPKKVPAIAPPPPLRPVTGLDRVIGKDARALVGLFGEPLQDIREPGARILQFGGGCILDAYLYPPAKGREPVVKHLEARLPDGRDTDRAACVMTLSRGR